MTERGLPSQLMERVGKPEPTMNFYSDKSKFKSAFGVDGSQIRPKKKQRNTTFADSQIIDAQEIGRPSYNKKGYQSAGNALHTPPQQKVQPKPVKPVAPKQVKQVTQVQQIVKQ